MDFGRIEAVDRIDFELPPDDPATARVLRSSGRISRNAGASSGAGAAAHARGRPRVLVGGPLWGHDGFVGRLYPPGTRRADDLRAYASQFDAVELNSTFYGVRRESFVNWRDSVPRRFRFFPKVPRGISHDLGLRGADRPLAEFLDALDALGDRCGTVWLQLPPDFGPRAFDRLRSFVEALPRERLRALGADFAIELRHGGWFREPWRSRVFGLLEEHAIAAVLSDAAGRRDVLHVRLTTPAVFLRFAGNDLHPTDLPRVDAWAERLLAWIAAGASPVCVFLHQPTEPKIVELAARLVPALERELGIGLRAPRPVDPVPEQGELFGGGGGGEGVRAGR